MATGGVNVQCSYVQMQAKKHSINPYNEWQDTQVEASFKDKTQLYCYLLITRLLSEVVGPTHFETICSQKGIRQQKAMFYKI